MRRTSWVVVALVMVAAGCSGDDGGSAPSTSAPSAPTTIATPTAVRVVTLNVLHGLFCAAETDSCQAPDRAQIVAEALEAADCPELVGFQEIGPRQEEVVPDAMAAVCDGRYELAWEAARSPDRAMVFTTLPIVEQGWLDLAAFPWEAYWVRVDADVGPIDFVTTHFASSSNNPPCDTEICPAVCPTGIEANRCNALEVLDHLSGRSGAVLQIASGDLNAPPDDQTVATFTAAGYVDAWSAAGQEECDAANPSGCTGGRDRPENPLDGLDVATGRYSERIDYVLARPGSDCDLSSQAEVLFGEPLDEPFRGLYWPSDHAGVLADLTCE